MDTVLPGNYWANIHSSAELVELFVEIVSAAVAAPIGSRAYRPRCSRAQQNRVFARRNFLGALASHVLAPPPRPN